MAIIARWHMPPSWKEYASMRCSGRGMPTRRSISIACARAAALSISMCSGWSPPGGRRWCTSATVTPWAPERSWRSRHPGYGASVRSGDRARPGRWSRRPCRGRQISPPTTRPGRSTRPRMDRAVTLLPQPDSPTRQTVRPEGRWSTPSTARTTPSWVWKWVRRSRTARSVRRRLRAEHQALPPVAPSGPVRVGGAQAVPHEVERQHGQDHGQARQQRPRRRRDGRTLWASMSSAPQLTTGARSRARASSAPSRPG